MIDPKGSANNTDEQSGMGMVDGKVETLTPEQHAQKVAERNAVELYDPEDEDDDLSDLDVLGQL